MGKLMVRLLLSLAFCSSIPAIGFSMAANQSPVYPGGRGWQPGEARYGVQIVRDLFITMDDGAVLEARLAYPTDLKTGERSTEQFPVLVEFTPYESSDKERLRHTFLTEHGYIVALVHPRGSGKSSGILEQFTSRDGLDGKAVVDWAAKLEGSNGKVGFFGASYPGALSLATAAKVGKDSPLKAVLAASIGLGAQYRQAWTNNGLGTVLMEGYSKQARDAMGGNEGAEIHFKDFEKRFWNGEDPAYDGAFWHDRLPLSWSKDIVENGIPVLQWGGWQDLNETGAIRGYVAFQNAMTGRSIHLPMAKGQKPSPRYQLIIGDWGHGIGMDIGVYLEWFDTWLKNADTGILETSTPLHFYEVGTNRWVNLAGYPSVDTYTTWYLGQNTMEEKSPAQGESVLRWGSPDAEDGKLIFESIPSSEGMTIAGPLSLQLYAKSSNTNMEVLARLYDVDVDGKMVMITKGALLGSLSKLDPKASWKDSEGRYTWPWPLLDRDRYAKPGEVHRYEMALEPIQYGIKPGHKVRLILSTQSLGNDSAQGFLVADPASLTAPQQKTVPGGVYTILFGGQTPTSINMPILPYQFYPEARAAFNPTSWSELTRDFDTTGYTLPVEW